MLAEIVEEIPILLKTCIQPGDIGCF